MAGNVGEWMRSLWGANRKFPDFRYPYRFGDGREAEIVNDTILRIIRGAGFYGDQNDSHCAYRTRSIPDSNSSGFTWG